LSAEGSPGGPGAVTVVSPPECVVGAAAEDVYSSVSPGDGGWGCGELSAEGLPGGPGTAGVGAVPEGVVAADNKNIKLPRSL